MEISSTPRRRKAAKPKTLATISELAVTASSPAMAIAIGEPIAGLIRPEGSLAHLLIRAATDPRAGIVFVQADESEVRHRYVELLAMATARLAGLRAEGIGRGAYAPLVTSQGLDFVISFWACMLGGIVAVPLSYPASFNGANNGLQKLFEVWRQLGRPKIVGDALLAERLGAAALEAGIDGLQVLVADALDRDAAGVDITPGHDGDLAFIQYSSGSTGSPKGVTLTHRNLLTNVEAIATAIRMQPGDTVLSWMPFSHDMGLIGMHLVPMFIGVDQVNLLPQSFVRRPMLWLEAIARHRAVFTGSPNFGYRLVLDRLDGAPLPGSLDLSSVRAIFNGAEPISVSTLREFVRALAPAHLSPTAMYPVYGMAEACVAVTFPPVGSLPLVRSVDRRALADAGVVALVAEDHADALLVVDEGLPVPSCRVRIVDDHGALIEEGRVGHVQIGGDNVTAGYHENMTADSECKDGDWLRTGDLGFLLDGRLSITGRVKDIVIVAGQKYFAYDIEACIETVDGVRAGKAAVSGWHDPEAGRERTAAFVAIKVPKGDAALKRQALVEVWRRVNATFSIALDHVVVVQQVPRTTSGKLQRYQLRDAFLRGDMKDTTFDSMQLARGDAMPAATHSKLSTPSMPPIDVTDVTNVTDATLRISTIWARILHRDVASIPLEQSFLTLGGTSIKAVQVLDAVEREFATRLDHAFLLDCRTVGDMARCLARSAATDNAAPVVPSSVSAPAVEADGDIAIIGMACRFPQADTPEAYWLNLVEGRDAITDVPADRWNADRSYDAGTQANGTASTGRTNSRWGGFITDAHAFDASFFGIPDDEARAMDPQQRLFLQTSWQALERAGCSGARSEGRAVGVFVGASHNNYLEHHLHGLDLTRLQQFESFGALQAAQRDALVAEWKRCWGEPGAQVNTAVDNLLNMIAARTSHALNLKGPSLAIDTACSSSLVAVHLACESLRRGECEMALAGGVNLNLSPTPYLLFARAGTLAPDGRCKVFDADADGFVPGEGVGVVVLKPLSKALADGDEVLAVIRRSFVNNDGRSLGVMAPNPDGQRIAISNTYDPAADTRSRALRPDGIQYVEAHGTGTAIGDPSELRSLARVFEGVAPGSCVVGSVKANIGHLLSAAGVASLIKMVLALQHRRMPPSLHVKQPTTQLTRPDSPFRVLQAAADWPAPTTGPRRGAINSFGFGGTNCHLVIEEAPTVDAVPVDVTSDPPAPHLLCLSARSDAALRQRTVDLARHLAGQPTARIADVSQALNAGRSHFEHRIAIVADTVERLVDQLGTAEPTQARRPAVALMFTGQGSQYPDMARRLYDGLPAFRRIVDECAAAFAPHLDEPLLDSLHGPRANAAALARTRLTQPAVFTIDYALGKLLLDWGVKPACLLGHSVGEYAAACLAGVMSLADAAKIVAARGRLIDALPAGGGMAAVFDTEPEVAALLEDYSNRLWFGAHNGSQQVVSGELAAIVELQARLQARGRICRTLQVSHAFHTPLLAPMLDDFARVLATVEFMAPRIPIVSNLGGTWMSNEPLGAAHWLAHVTAPVCFEQGIRLAAERGVGAFVECGPDKVLTGLARAALGASPALVLPLLDRKRDDVECLLGTLGRLYAEGVDIDWQSQGRDIAATRIVLPTYPFARQDHRIATDDSGSIGAPTAFLAATIDLTPALSRPSTVEPPVHAPAPQSATWRDVVQQEVADIAQVAPLQVDMYRNFHDLGLDSATAVRLAERLGQVARMRLQPTLLFEYQSPAALVDYLDTLGPVPPAAPPVPTPPPPVAAPPVATRLHYEAPSGNAEPALRDHDIAIIGMACRVPGADTLEDYWQMLVEGRSAIREIEPGQWSQADYFRGAEQQSHTSYSKWGAFLDKPWDFDPLFFGISPREAEVMDPQQRLFLQVAFESLQQSGYGGDFRTREIGIFVGCEQNHYGEHFIMNQRYQALARRLDGMAWIDALPAPQRDQLRTTMRDVLQPAELIPDAVAGQGLNEIAARVSHWLDLRGPNLVLNTACSSSLVALHLACASLRSGESRMAIAGATYLTGNDSPFVFLSRLGALSPSGRCTPFDERADGMVLGEGVSAVVLKPLKDAVRDGDFIHAVIKGSAVNNDGHSNGITAPNPRGQAEAIHKAYADAGMTPEAVSYVECHGTGTPLGDPVELDGMTQAFRKFTDRKTYCAIGSVKSTVGHMLSGSSLPGLIKVVLSLQHRVIPPTHGFEKPNPHIDFASSPFYVVAGRPQSWTPQGDQPLCAGINSFGFGGTNCHVVIEEAPRLVASTPTTTQATPPSTQLVLLTGRTQAVLHQVALRLDGALERHPDYSAAQVALSLNGAQRDLAFKAALRVRDVHDLRDKLAALAAGRIDADVDTGRSNPKQSPLAYLVLDGVNPLDDREVDELIADYPQLQEICTDCTRHYQDAMVQSHALNQQHLDGLLFSFAVQYAIGRLLLSAEIKPQAIVAEGTGVLAGACLLGMLSLQQATAMLCRVALGRHDALDAFEESGERSPLRNCPLIIPGAVLQQGQGQDPTQAQAAVQLAGYLRLPRRLAASDIQPLRRGDPLFVHVGGAVDLRGQVESPAAGDGSTAVDRSAETARWIDLPPAAHANDRLLALFGRMYVRGLRFNTRLLATPGVRRVPLPGYPFENKPYRCKPIALPCDAPSTHGAIEAAATRPSIPPAPVPAPAPTAPRGLVPMRSTAPAIEAPPNPGRLLPVAGQALSTAQRKAAHDALLGELSQLQQN